LGRVRQHLLSRELARRIAESLLVDGKIKVQLGALSLKFHAPAFDGR
jgi:hypothetical protein